jgi:hypothetical protein
MIEQQRTFWDDCTSRRTAGLFNPKMRPFRFADRNIEYLSFGYRRQINIALLSASPDRYSESKKGLLRRGG